MTHSSTRANTSTPKLNHTTSSLHTLPSSILLSDAHGVSLKPVYTKPDTTDITSSLLPKPKFIFSESTPTQNDLGMSQEQLSREEFPLHPIHSPVSLLDHADVLDTPATQMGETHTSTILPVSTTSTEEKHRNVPSSLSPVDSLIDTPS